MNTSSMNETHSPQVATWSTNGSPEYLGVCLKQGDTIWESSDNPVAFQISGNQWLTRFSTNRGNTIRFRGNFGSLRRAYFSGSILDSPGWFMFIPSELDIGNPRKWNLKGEASDLKEFRENWEAATDVGGPIDCSTAYAFNLCWAYQIKDRHSL